MPAGRPYLPDWTVPVQRWGEPRVQLTASARPFADLGMTGHSGSITSALASLIAAMTRDSVGDGHCSLASRRRRTASARARTARQR